MRGIILRHDADELIIKPDQRDIERFAEGAPVATTRYYGGNGTIHQTGYVDVEVYDGFIPEVVAVWFRCQPLPFKASLLRPNGDKVISYPGGYQGGSGHSTFPGRADDMRRMYRAIAERGGPFSLAGVFMEK